MAPTKSNDSNVMSRTSFEYIYNHLVLPRRLPGTQDASPKNETILLDFVLQSLERFLPGRRDNDAINAGISMLRFFRTARNYQGYLRDVGVQEAFQSLSIQAPVVVLQITEQNAGVLVSRQDESVCFEMFELCTPSESITSTRGRLVRSFPATAAEIPLAVFESEDFRVVISKTLTKMSQQSIRETKQRQRESQEQHQKEVDDMADPMVITELFTSMLLGCGKAASTKGICKNTRDDIMCKDSKSSWRRSPMWLLIRVALQLTMTRLSREDDNTYKEFMAFLVAQVLCEANQQPKMSSDILKITSIKVSRRLSKLDHPSDGPWLSEIRRIIFHSQDTLNERWKHICKQAEPSLNLHQLSKFKIMENTDFSLKSMEDFLNSVSLRKTVSHRPRFRPSLKLAVLSQSRLPIVADCSEADLPLHLIEIETWVADNLPFWIDLHMKKSDHPVSDLKQLIESYHRKAAIYYSRRPEGASRMILTIGELWYAADLATVHEIPLLANYEPQIPTMVLQALLLSSTQEMQRLKRLEDYVDTRSRLAQHSETPLIFFSFGESGSFAVEYYSQSPRHQQMKNEIEKEADDKRQEKLEEYRKAKANYVKLMQKHAACECDVSAKWDEGIRIYIHPSSCRRCAFESKAKSLAVFIHEWPLPQDEFEAQATVFELAPPETFSKWRDLTLYFIVDVLLSQPDNPPTPMKCYSLKTYQPLKPWYASKGHSRIQLWSSAKPNTIIHRRAIPVGHSVESDVCLSNGLEYRYYDENQKSFCSGLSVTDGLSEMCTFKLPERAATLSRFIRRTWKKPNGETPNNVIASQHQCPTWMSLGEFKALAGLPFGHKIQWMSILTQLAMPKVDFNRPETVLFLLQLSLQAGPKSSQISRSTHTQLCDGEFAQKMLESLKTCVLRVQENWESHTALWCFTCLAARLLSIVPVDLTQPFLDLLAQCRKISHRWLKTLLERVEETSSKSQRAEFSETALSIALVCADSFNVHDGNLLHILHDSEQASTLIECAIIINDNAELIDEDANFLSALKLDRWRHTMYRARPILAEEHASGNSFLSSVTQRYWRYFKSASPWTPFAGTNCWYQTTIDNLRIDLNILTGKLLTNDLPSSRLPMDYVSHDVYQRLFKESLFLVMPSVSPGMVFCTAQLLHGHTVHFGRQGQDLLIRLENGVSSFDIVPPRVLLGTLPDLFANEYVHWYDNNTGIVHFCPTSNPFPIESGEWHLQRHAEFWKLHRDNGVFLVAPSSGIAQHVAKIMAHLETPLNLHMLYDEKKSRVEISMPRLQLQFFLDEGESAIRSRQFGNMQVDRDQSVGTLIGLASKLVLRSPQDPPMRLLIVPEGKINFKRQGSDMTHDHVVVSLLHGTSRRVQAYQMDELLGRLVANTKLESKLYLAYLHALTSFCLPDPLSGKRGADMALEILCSASVRAPTALSPAARSILDLIAALAPSRHYYRENSRMIQNVTWSPELSLLTQDDRFYKVTNDILQRSAGIEFLYLPTTSQPDPNPHSTMELVLRAISREFRPDLNTDDLTYHSRDSKSSHRIARATEIATRAFHRNQGLIQPVSGGLALHLYKLMATGKLIEYSGAPLKRDLEYDSLWLRKPSAFISSYWCRLQLAFQENQEWLSKMELVVWLSAIAYSNEHDEQITQALLMMALSPVVAAAPLPSGTHDLSKGYVLRPDTVEAAAASHMIRSKQGPDGKSRARVAKGDGKAVDRLKRDYGKDKRQAIHIFRDGLARQWPCQTPKQPSDYQMEAYVDVEQAMRSILPPWRSWWANRKFKEYLEGFVASLKQIPIETAIVENAIAIPVQPVRHRVKRSLPAVNLFCHNPPKLRSSSPSSLKGLVERTGTESKESEKLSKIIDFLESRSRLQHERQYLQELRQSLSSSEDYGDSKLAYVDARAALFDRHLTECKTRYEHVYSSLYRAMQPNSKPEASDPKNVVQAILSESNFLPTVSPLFLLQQLRNSKWSKLSTMWKDAIIEYGLAVAALQKAKRLIRLQHDPIDLLRELENIGHEGWSPCDYPEWLLLECESDITIRKVQQQIAESMIQPPNNDNAVMQLNMGEGKSSIIVPIVSSALGNGLKLVRVIVAKPQARQMYQMLESKISGLLDRPVYQLPFSRDVSLDIDRAKIIHRLLVSCQEEGGVLLVQPEHLLSLQLMELELTLSNRLSVAEDVMKIRRLFEESSRDVVDESDENFSVKFELVYTLGEQRSIEHSPDRWIIVQEILSLLNRFSAEVKFELPQSLEIDNRDGARYPRIRILRLDAQDIIFDRIAEYICETGMAGFPIARQPPRTRNAIRKYITQWDLSVEESEDVEHSQFWDETTINHILLLRGLLAGGILSFALCRKRWRVDYGLDKTRDKKTQLAVPYRAKDSPTPRSEFSHPDIVIVLTCLSYYYGGLEDQSLFDSLELLARSANADLEYQAWVQTAPKLPEPFKQLQGINLKDRIQCTSDIFPHLRYSKAAIDYYVCRMVFPKEAKEFPHKLSASGWDLGKKKLRSTTGFSGTNDSKYILPLDVKQLDLPEQSHTNALVLKNLLRSENSVMSMSAERRARAFDAQNFLEMLTTMSSKPRVILDVGAQIIDYTNLELARLWLEHYGSDEKIQAVVFFNELDDIMVLDKSGQSEELQTSPYASNLDRCLVYLDEAHTRGTDLRLPANYQAAVTLGAQVTKDRLVQACMRMRRLGRGQSVVFIIPRDIEQEICLLRGRERSVPPEITVSDVLCWAIETTCNDLRRAVPLWLSQGLRFTKQQSLWNHLTDQIEDGSRLECGEKFKEDDARSLEMRYRPRRARHDVVSMIDCVDSRYAVEFQNRCHQFGLTEIRNASFDEEQERELSPEAEQERQVETPPQAEAAEHRIHPGLKEFILRGLWPKDPFLPAFMTLKNTTAAQYFDVSEFSNAILVTQDFSVTVNGSFGPGSCSDLFQRSVQWVLSIRKDPNVLIIISPYEAQELLPIIEQSKHVVLHLYSSKVNLGHESLEDLNLYSLPNAEVQHTILRPVISHLCLFSGQLYLSSFDDYVILCNSLGLAWDTAKDDVLLGPDGFIISGQKQKDIEHKSAFSKSPVPFLKGLMTKIRHDSEHIEKTHMGRILAGVRLLETDF